MEDAGTANRWRHARLAAYTRINDQHWLTKTLFAAGMAGFLALMSHVAIPLPWTPVPFSFQVFGVLVTGAYLGRHYGLLSIGFYVLAGAIGLPVFAQQESSGLDVLTGHTAGYIVGFAFAAYFIGWWLEARRTLPRRATLALVLAVAAMSVASLVAMTWLVANGERFDETWSVTRSATYLVLGATVLAVVAAIAITRQAQGRAHDKWGLWLAMMGAIGIIHAIGVPVLKWTLDWSWPQAIALGSTVFLPLDTLKAALAVAATVPFLPSPHELEVSQ